MLTCASVEEFIDFTLKIVECSLKLMRKKSLVSAKPVHQHVFIFDLEGFSLKVPHFSFHYQFILSKFLGSNTWSNTRDSSETDFNL